MKEYKKYLTELDNREGNAKEWIKQDIRQNIYDIINDAGSSGYEEIDVEKITDEIMNVINNSLKGE